MKLTNERKMYLRLCEQKKQNKRNREVMHDILKLYRMVSPAIVYLADEIGAHKHPSLSKFAATHGYDVPKFLKLLREEGIFVKQRGTWVLTPQYRDMGLVFYTIGRLNIYSCLDMFLLPEGERFMEQFIAAHPIRHRNKQSE